MSAITTLIYDSISFPDLASGVNPRFICPACHYAWQPKLSLGASFPSVFNFNQKVNLTVPSHNDPKTGKSCPVGGRILSLFVAIYRDTSILARSVPNIRVQRSDGEGVSGIPADWWSK